MGPHRGDAGAHDGGREGQADARDAPLQHRRIDGRPEGWGDLERVLASVAVDFELGGEDDRELSIFSLAAPKFTSCSCP